MATPPDFVSGAVLTAAQMNAIGLWQVHSAAFTSVSSVTINDVFTSDFTNYKLFLNKTSGATNGSITIQFTVAGTATTTNYTDRSILFHATPTPGIEAFADFAGTDEILLALNSTTTQDNTAAEVTIFGPQIASRTKLHSVGPQSFGGNPLYWSITMGLQTTATQFDGCKVLFPANATGTISIYGLRD